MWHYQAIKLPDGYKNIIEVIKGSWELERVKI